MKCTTGLAAISLISYISSPVLARYIDPIILQDIRAAKVAARSNGEYFDGVPDCCDSLIYHDTPILLDGAEEDETIDSDLEQNLTRRGKFVKFLTKFSTAGARKSVKFAKHNPKTATVFVGAIAAKTAYSILKPDDDHHPQKTIIYVKATSRPPISRREANREADFDEEEDEDESIYLTKRTTGPVDSFVGKTIKKTAIGTKKFSKKNPWTAAAVGGTLLTAGAVKVYNTFKDDDKSTQVVRLVKRGILRDGNEPQADDAHEDDTKFRKRGPPQSHTQRAKAFLKTKKGKVVVGAMGVKAAMTVGFLSYMRNKNQQQAPVLTPATHRPTQVYLSAPKAGTISEKDEISPNKEKASVEQDGAAKEQATVAQEEDKEASS